MSDRFWAKTVNSLATVSLRLEAQWFKSLKWHEGKWVITLKRSSFSQQLLARCHCGCGRWHRLDPRQSVMVPVRMLSVTPMWEDKNLALKFGLLRLFSVLFFFFSLGWRCVMPMTGSSYKDPKKAHLLHLSSTDADRGVCLCLLFFLKINNQLLGFADVKQ